MNAMTPDPTRAATPVVALTQEKRASESTGQHLERLARGRMIAAQDDCRHIAHIVGPWIDEVEGQLKPKYSGGVDGPLATVMNKGLISREAVKHEFMTHQQARDGELWAHVRYHSGSIDFIVGACPLPVENVAENLEVADATVLKHGRHIDYYIKSKNVPGVLVSLLDAKASPLELQLVLHIDDESHVLGKDASIEAYRLIEKEISRREAEAKAEEAAVEAQQRHRQGLRDQFQQMQAARHTAVRGNWLLKQEGWVHLQLDVLQWQLLAYGYRLTLDPNKNVLPKTFRLQRRAGASPAADRNLSFETFNALMAETRGWETRQVFPVSESGLKQAAGVTRLLLQELAQQQALRIQRNQWERYAQKVLPCRVVWDALFVALNWNHGAEDAPWYNTEVGALWAELAGIAYYPQTVLPPENNWWQTRQLEHGLQPTHSGPTYESERLPDGGWSRARVVPEPVYDHGGVLRKRRALRTQLLVLYMQYQWRLSWAGWRVSWPDLRVAWGGKAFWRTRVHGLKPQASGMHRWVMLDRAFGQLLQRVRHATYQWLKMLPVLLLSAARGDDPQEWLLRERDRSGMQPAE